LLLSAAAARQFAAAKKRPPIGVTSFQHIFSVNPAAAEPTISMTALLELLKDADPEMKAKLRLALLT